MEDFIENNKNIRLEIRVIFFIIIYFTLYIKINCNFLPHFQHKNHVYMPFLHNIDNYLNLMNSLLLIWFGVGFFLLWLGKNVWAKRVLGVLLGLMLMVALFPIGEWLLYPLETKYPHNPQLEDVDGIIVLSGSENPVLTKSWNQVSVGGAIERNLAFMMLARQHPEAILVFTGGVGSMLQNAYLKSKEWMFHKLFLRENLVIPGKMHC